MVHPVLLNGKWVPAQATGTFQASNPATGEVLPDVYPISSWADCDRALEAAREAAEVLLSVPPEQLAQFLESYAAAIDRHAAELADIAALETGLAVSPRLKDVEIPRTTNQLRQAAQGARTADWTLPTIDTASQIRSWHGPLGPVICIGPNNFPFAYNGIAGGDFAAAIAAGNPVIAKGHPAHPTTSRQLAELCAVALHESGLPSGSVQMLYRMGHADGLRLVADPRAAATGFTGSRNAGMALKAACDAAGKLAYLEMSSVNPVVILPGAIAERSAEIAEQFCTSCLMATGQFCTNPGLVVTWASSETETLISAVAQRFAASPAGTLLGENVRNSLEQAVQRLVAAGAQLVTGGRRPDRAGFSYENTLLRVSGRQFLAAPELFQTEMFGAASLWVVADSPAEIADILRHLEGNLTGTIYSARDGADEPFYEALAPLLRQKVGRLNNDKMPTGVAVVASMNHGGPYPSTGHPGFTAVGFPATIRRFSMLQSFDNVREHRLPLPLRNANPTGKLWRLIDGEWSQRSL